jgi:UrcA family protein
MKQALKIIAVSALATAALIKGVPALAEPVAANVTIVPTADLDLSSPAGQEALDHRLVRAVVEVCESASSADLSGQNQVRRCRSEVLDAARRQGADLIAGRTAKRGLLIAVR